MPNFKIDDPDYWQVPDRFAPMVGITDDIRSSWFLMGDAASDESPVAAVLQLEPGGVISRHGHDCERFEVIVSGSLHVDDTVLHPGDVMVAHPGQFYGPHIAGPDGCVTVEIFSKASGAYKVIYEDQDDQRFTVNYLEGPHHRPEGTKGMEDIQARVAKVLDGSSQ
jgi:hypothetical protein